MLAFRVPAESEAPFRLRSPAARCARRFAALAVVDRLRPMRRLAREIYRYSATFQGWLWFGSITLFFGLIPIPIALGLAPVWRGAGAWSADLTHRALALYGRTCLYMRIGVEGRERRMPGTRILVANHQSWLHPPRLMGAE